MRLDEDPRAVRGSAIVEQEAVEAGEANPEVQQAPAVLEVATTGSSYPSSAADSSRVEAVEPAELYSGWRAYFRLRESSETQDSYSGRLPREATIVTLLARLARSIDLRHGCIGYRCIESGEQVNNLVAWAQLACLCLVMVVLLGLLIVLLVVRSLYFSMVPLVILLPLCYLCYNLARAVREECSMPFGGLPESALSNPTLTSRARLPQPKVMKPPERSPVPASKPPPPQTPVRQQAPTTEPLVSLPSDHQPPHQSSPPPSHRTQTSSQLQLQPPMRVAVPAPADAEQLSTSQLPQLPPPLEAAVAVASPLDLSPVLKPSRLPAPKHLTPPSSYRGYIASWRMNAVSAKPANSQRAVSPLKHKALAASMSPSSPGPEDSQQPLKLLAKDGESHRLNQIITSKRWKEQAEPSALMQTPKPDASARAKQGVDRARMRSTPGGISKMLSSSDEQLYGPSLRSLDKPSLGVGGTEVLGPTTLDKYGIEYSFDRGRA